MKGTLLYSTKGDPVMFIPEQEKFDLAEWGKLMNTLDIWKKQNKNVIRKTILKLKKDGI